MLTELSHATRAAGAGTIGARMMRRWKERFLVDPRRDARRYDDLIIRKCRHGRLEFANGADRSSAAPFDASQGVIGIGTLRGVLFWTAIGIPHQS